MRSPVKTKAQFGQVSGQLSQNLAGTARIDNKKEEKYVKYRSMVVIVASNLVMEKGNNDKKTLHPIRIYDKKFKINFLKQKKGFLKKPFKR